ncbi:hypothetical protein N7478_004026 [Penicillium angulare]|uniref:uncharacterized protein n=1 Tax=Penicillium angulare TaxID=116970 RepID=UPI002541C149|nr:uncharacterized protein N7478_004026 [Penicillium angulare]KAJ5278654.1 hypothetical protein N7478_004026 [Penicillium angulare]
MEETRDRHLITGPKVGVVQHLACIGHTILADQVLNNLSLGCIMDWAFIHSTEDSERRFFQPNRMLEVPDKLAPIGRPTGAKAIFF